MAFFPSLRGRQRRATGEHNNARINRAFFMTTPLWDSVRLGGQGCDQIFFKALAVFFPEALCVSSTLSARTEKALRSG
jgi:hypothetical protein